MIVLGINGGFDLSYQHADLFDTGQNHDSAAALLIDGKIVQAVEEERLNRIKHTNKFPVQAIQAVLEEQQVKLSEVDFFSIYATEEFVGALIKQMFWADTKIEKLLSPREYVAKLFLESFNFILDEDKICFVDHHTAHAASSYYLSGFEESLVLTLDGVGENISGRILYAKGAKMEAIEVIKENDSLGHFYLEVINFMGYTLFDEYKVMGLAPYGDPSVYRDTFSLFYTLLPEGRYKINKNLIRLLLDEIGQPRRKGQDFSQLYQNVAAALQESVEKIILHILSYHSQKSGYKNLCLAGGVAHNCSANGKIYYSGLFEDIFIQPASHDAGNSVGAAICTYLEKSGEKSMQKLEHVFISTPLEADSEIANLLNNWNSFVDFKKLDNIESRAAELIAEGNILGWVQGKSEFGPRALGNRSIVADPRPEENKGIVNQMVKKREAYRPFAPSVLKEKADEFFEIKPSDTCFDYMTFVVNVKEKYTKELGAITHVDGTARVQTVNKTHNPKYWNLINEFGKLSGIPMVLNTSFNNNVEPIVDTAEDAIVCYLTTGLDYLVIGDYLISKKRKDYLPVLAELVPRRLKHAVIHAKNSFDSFDESSTKYEIGVNYSTKQNRPISREAYEWISKIDGEKTIQELLAINPSGNGDSKTRLLQEINELWELRLISLSPAYKMKEAAV